MEINVFLFIMTMTEFLMAVIINDFTYNDFGNFYSFNGSGHNGVLHDHDNKYL